MNDEAHTRIAILVPSCDRYRDLWAPFFHCLRRSWPACPLDVYLVTNTALTTIVGVQTIAVGVDEGWSASLTKALSIIPHPYVLLLLEDLLLLKEVKHLELMHVLRRAVDASVNCLKLNPLPPPDQPFDECMGIVLPGTHYRVSTVATLWKKAILTELLRDGENAWDFELKGSARSDALAGFYACWTPHLPVSNAIVRGRWHPKVMRRAQEMGARIDLSARPGMGRLARLRYACALVRCRILARLPAKSRRAVRSVFLETPEKIPDGG